ncbi:uncharacterized protein LOC123030846 [Varanus komodoensis]|uniref:uncharacterized protein LOC123030846 n=1 Tax=Varanus komodoensis TaxID=61221 RepID=UPI001CF7DA2B|nr:uncharacterized protein LOC123030846 [Varanus komodoensis]
MAREGGERCPADALRSRRHSALPFCFVLFFLGRVSGRGRRKPRRRRQTSAIGPPPSLANGRLRRRRGERGRGRKSRGKADQRRGASRRGGGVERSRRRALSFLRGRECLCPAVRVGRRQRRGAEQSGGSFPAPLQSRTDRVPGGGCGKSSAPNSGSSALRGLGCPSIKWGHEPRGPVPGVSGSCARCLLKERPQPHEAHHRDRESKQQNITSHCPEFIKISLCKPLTPRRITRKTVLAQLIWLECRALASSRVYVYRRHDSQAQSYFSIEGENGLKKTAG